MKKIRTCKDLNNALKGGLWVEDTKLVRDLVVKCRKCGLLKFGY